MWSVLNGEIGQNFLGKFSELNLVGLSWYDAAENNWPAYQSSKHYEVARYYTVDEHTRVPEVQLISEYTWKKLSEEYRQIILECAKESSEYEQEIWKAQEKTSRKIAKERGCQEIFLSEDDLQSMRETASPIYEKYCAEYMELIEDIHKIPPK